MANAGGVRFPHGGRKVLAKKLLVRFGPVWRLAAELGVPKCGETKADTLKAKAGNNGK